MSEVGWPKVPISIVRNEHNMLYYERLIMIIIIIIIIIIKYVKHHKDLF